MMQKHIFVLINKDVKAEYRQAQSFSGIALYLASTVFVVYMSFKAQAGAIEPSTWNSLFWIVILFLAVNAIAKSFMKDNNGRLLYYYSIAGAQVIILSKIIYNFVFLFLLSLVGFGMFVLLMGSPVELIGLFAVGLLLGTFGLTATFAVASSISSKAAGSYTLLAVLSFPVVIPVLLNAHAISQNAINGIALADTMTEILTLSAINVLIVAVSLLLFPAIWRS